MSPYQCAHCKKTLSFIEHARSLYCEKPICQRAKVQLYLAENKQRLTAQVIAELEKFIKHTPARKLPSRLRKELKKTSPLIALLPANTNQLTELDQKRKLEFLRHVSMIYKDVKTHNPSANRVYSEQLDPPLPKDEAQLLGNACATCMGYCCRLGQTHAFVDYPTLKHLLASQPAEFSEKDLLDLYSDYFPEQSYQNSCVFQGNKGCTLPRDVRSITCNNFLCDEVKKYRHEVLQADSELTFAVAVDKNTIMFTSAYSHENFIRVKEKKA
ncbi:MAG: Fe-S-cluster containining protein [Paraglaciecola sp.]|jgi:Fe-S-cluster containining protein